RITRQEWGHHEPRLAKDDEKKRPVEPASECLCPLTQVLIQVGDHIPKTQDKLEQGGSFLFRPRRTGSEPHRMGGAGGLSDVSAPSRKVVGWPGGGRGSRTGHRPKPP